MTGWVWLATVASGWLLFVVPALLFMHGATRGAAPRPPAEESDDER